MVSSLAITLFLASACAAHPLINLGQNNASSLTLPFAKRFNFTGVANLLENDRARAHNLFSALEPPSDGVRKGEKGSYEVAVTNILVSYVVEVGIGSPASKYSLIVDTGSSNTWVGASEKYHITSTSHPTAQPMAVTYGTGKVTGELVVDKLSIGGLVLKNQTIGNAQYADGFDGVDGILGIGPTALTQGTTVPTDVEIPTIVDTAAADGLISSKVVGIYFQPPTSDHDTNGALTFGHVDTTKCTEALYEIPITSHQPAGRYVGIDQSITYGSLHLPILPTTSGIVDTGTSLLLLATDAYNAYMRATGAELDKASGLLFISPDQYSRLESLYFRIGSKTFEFTANAQIWPRSFNADIGGQSDRVYLVIGDAGSNIGSGINFINGQAFLERFYTTYDSGNNTFGIAPTKYTTWEGN